MHEQVRVVTMVRMTVMIVVIMLMLVMMTVMMMVMRKIENKNNQEDELMDDFVYWDSIGGHVDDQARPPNRQNGVRQEFGNI